MATQVSRFVGSTLLICLLGLVQGWQLKKNWPSLAPENRAKQITLWAWLFLTFIPVSVGKRFEDHYFLFLVPTLSILAAAALDSWTALTWKKYRIPVLLAVILPTLGFGLTRFWIHETYQRWGGEEMNDYRPYGEFLRQRSSHTDRILVWGCAPAVYLYADRNPATRFLRTDTLAGRVAGLNDTGAVAADFLDYIRPGSWELFFEDMKKHPPEYILDTAPTGLHEFRQWPMGQYPDLVAFLKQRYVSEAPFQGATVYRRSDLH
jgi:hypothetical protein